MNVDSKLHTALSPQQLVELFHDRDIHQPKRRLDVIPYDKIINTDDIIDTLFSRNPFCVVFYPAAQANNTTFGHFVALCHDEHHKTVYFYDPLGYLPDEYKKFADKHPPVEAKWYAEALRLAGSGHPVVISDDPKWCRKQLPRHGFPEVATWISGNDAATDMCLMSLCDHHVIANSSFSWWGAWLNASTDKKVVHPSRWFGPGLADRDTRDVPCQGWIAL